MDNERFDALIKMLETARATRGGVLRGLAGVAAAAVGGVVLAERGDAKGKKKGKGKVRSQRAAQADAGKVTICHFTHSEENPYNLIEVSANSLTAHKKHGDFIHGDCCLDSDCPDLDDPCNVNRCVVNDDDTGFCTPVCVEEGKTCDDADKCTENDQCRLDSNGLSCSCRGTAIVCPACLECDADAGTCTIDTCPDGETCNPETGECEGGGSCGESGDECDGDGECCDGLICRSDDTCGACSPSGNDGPCGDDHDCCGNQGGVICYQETCCNGRAPGAACNNNNQCCSNSCTGSAGNKTCA